MTDYQNIEIGSTVKVDYTEPARLHRHSETEYRAHRRDEHGDWATVANIDRVDDDEHPWWVSPPFDGGPDGDGYSGFRAALWAGLALDVPNDPTYFG
ncbi:hypothetical protein [Curtobacterium sp. Arg-1]|uniref:hypothetical protein n=1 Tax=Curtobacterium sp. Arg-1 TaxID=2935040 RepID=UPI0021D7F02D|nr:hypothetical protein [Curtobacterium sp. Arg-1]UXZ57144.1 hypothetical protein MXD64_14230 [Curtobacterium sp. Arg-1]